MYPFNQVILRKLCAMISEVYGFDDEKVFDIFDKMGLFNGNVTSCSRSTRPR
jgi:hypothetical protein